MATAITMAMRRSSARWRRDALRWSAVFDLGLVALRTGPTRAIRGCFIDHQLRTTLWEKRDPEQREMNGFDVLALRSFFVQLCEAAHPRDALGPDLKPSTAGQWELAGVFTLCVQAVCLVGPTFTVFFFLFLTCLNCLLSIFRFVELLTCMQWLRDRG